MNKSNPKNYLPFDALEGYKDSLKVTEKNKLKSKKRQKSEDKLKEINDNLILAINNNLNVKVVYYDSGFYLSIVGRIKEVNSINRKIIMSNFKLIDFKDVSDIIII